MFPAGALAWDHGNIHQMTSNRYMARITTANERKTLAVEPVWTDTLEEARLYADIMYTRLMVPRSPMTVDRDDPPIADTRTTVLMRPDLDFDQWVVSCWRVNRDAWQYPESL